MASVPLTGVVFGTAAITTSIRYQLNVRFCGAKLFTPSKASSSPNASLLEECWLFVLSNLLLALSTWALVYHNDACSFVDTSACFSDWKHQVNSPQQQLVYSISLGWYIHGVIKSLVPGIGLHAGNDMVAHHFVTVVAFIASYAFQLERMGLLLLGILNISNPFMHFAKVLHYSGFEQKYKVAAFSAFAAAFFVSRLVLFPIQVYWNGISAMIEHWHEASLIPGIVCLVLATFLQALQVFWFYRIVRILVNGKADKAPAKHSDADEPATLKAQLHAREKDSAADFEQPGDALLCRKTDSPDLLECSSLPTSEPESAPGCMPDGFLTSENGSESSTPSTNFVAMDDSAHGADGNFHRPGDLHRLSADRAFPCFDEMTARAEAAEPKKLK